MEQSKRLYRNPEKRVLGGVCSGLGAYFNTDPLLIRIIFIVVTIIFTSGILVYLIMWMIMPEARTEAQKREMFGENFNFKDFKQKAKSEYEDIKSKFKL